LWPDFRLLNQVSSKLGFFVSAIQKSETVAIIYEGGQSKSKFRLITPKGIVRNPDGDYVHAECKIDHQRKRFYLSKILDFKPA
jgi:DNA polymerase-3 subunit epsilon